MSPIEAVLRLFCTGAIDPALSLPDAISLYRSVAAIARALRTQMADEGLPRGFPPDLLALLADVLHSVCGRALASGAAPATTARLALSISQISTACHLARPRPEKAPKTTPAPKAQPAPAPKPVAAKPAPVLPAPTKPVAPADRALMDQVMADMTRRTILDYKRAA